MRPRGSLDSKPRNRGWTAEQIQSLKLLYYTKKDEELKSVIGKSVRQIRLKARELQMGPKIGIGKHL